MESKGYFRVPRTLTRTSLWMNLPPAYRDVFYVILDHACYLPYEFDDHGQLITLQRGQFCASIREITNLCGKHGDKNAVERGISKLVQYGIMRKEVRHSRMLLTISHIDTYELIYDGGETASETELRQNRDSFETQRKKENKENKENKEHTPPYPQTEEIPMEAKRVSGGGFINSFSFSKTKDSHESNDDEIDFIPLPKT